MARVNLGRAPATYDPQWMARFIRDIELAVERAGQRPNGAYGVTGLTTLLRDIDAGTADLATVRSVLATLINDLQKAGRLS